MFDEKWEVNNNEQLRKCGVIGIIDDTSLSVGNVRFSHNPRATFEIAQKRASLIAAAPKLLSALIQAEKIVQQANLLSTATEADKDATLKRLFYWLNMTRAEAIDAAGVPGYEFWKTCKTAKNL